MQEKKVCDRRPIGGERMIYLSCFYKQGKAKERRIQGGGRLIK